MGRRSAKGQHSGDIGNGIQGLPFAFRERGLGDFVAQAQVEGKILGHVPVVIAKTKEHILVAVIGGTADRALTEIIWDLIREISLEEEILIIATGALRETLRGDVLTVFSAELKVVPSLHPANVIHNLVEVLIGKLGSVASSGPI